MSDAVVLIALAQVISFGGLLFLYVQVQSVMRSTSLPPAGPTPQRQRPARKTLNDADAILARLGELDVDVPAMARRMHKSEEEIRLLLRRQSPGRSG
jgi:hypothetical protein